MDQHKDRKNEIERAVPNQLGKRIFRNGKSAPSVSLLINEHPIPKVEQICNQPKR